MAMALMRRARVVMGFMVVVGLNGELVRLWDFAMPWGESYFFGLLLSWEWYLKEVVGSCSVLE